MCHLILLLPIIGLPLFWLRPLSAALPIYLVILLLSAWVYYFTIAAMRREVTVGPETLLHSHGVVVSQYGIKITVRIQGELWTARSAEDLHPGDAIEVVTVDGLTLRVCRIRPVECDALA